MSKNFNPSKNLWVNIGFALLVGLLLLFIAIQGLGWYTNHSERIKVPKLTGKSFDEAKIELEMLGLNCVIIDSMYSEKLPAFSVVEQNPPIDMEVKPGRTIYLTINSGNKPKIKAPKLTDMSITLAKAVLKNRGFELGTISYTYDEIGNNLVVEQFYRGRALEAGTLLPKGSTIDLKVASTDRQYQSTTDSVGIINDEDVSDEFGI